MCCTKINMPSYRKDNRYLVIDGETKTLQQWSEESGNPENLIHWRLAHDWEPYRAVYQLPRKYNNRAQPEAKTHEETNIGE